MAGRPKNKEYGSIDERLEDIIFKLFDPQLDKNGKLIFKRNNERLTLDDMSFVTWIQDGRKTTKPITKVGFEHREWSILKRVKRLLNDNGFSDDDLKDLIYHFTKPMCKVAAYGCVVDDSIDG